MSKPQIQEKSNNTFHLLPKPRQLALLQNVRDSHVNRKKFITEKEEVISDMAEEHFVENILTNGLSEEWMEAINTGRP